MKRTIRIAVEISGAIWLLFWVGAVGLGLITVAAVAITAATMTLTELSMSSLFQER
jgi:hypothetical protein